MAKRPIYLTQGDGPGHRAACEYLGYTPSNYTPPAGGRTVRRDSYQNERIAIELEELEY